MGRLRIGADRVGPSYKEDTNVAPMADVRAAVTKKLPHLTAQELSGLAFAALEVQPVMGGVSPKLAVTAPSPAANDSVKAKFLKATFKIYTKTFPYAFEAESGAIALKRLVGEPTTQVVKCKVDNKGVLTDGYAKLHFKNEDSPKGNARDWSPELRNSIMSQAVWSWFLGDYDAKTQQFKTVEVDVNGKKCQIAVFSDNDHALVDYASSHPRELTRFRGLGLSPIPCAFQRVLEAYVKNEIILNPFNAVYDTIDRIEAGIGKEQLAEAFGPWADKVFANQPNYGEWKSKDEAIEGLFQVLKGLRGQFQRLEATVEKERSEGESPKSELRDELDDLGQRLLDDPVYDKGIRGQRNAELEFQKLKEELKNLGAKVKKGFDWL